MSVPIPVMCSRGSVKSRPTQCVTHDNMRYSCMDVAGILHIQAYNWMSIKSTPEAVMIARQIRCRPNDSYPSGWDHPTVISQYTRNSKPYADVPEAVFTLLTSTEAPKSGDGSTRSQTVSITESDENLEFKVGRAAERQCEKLAAKLRRRWAKREKEYAHCRNLRRILRTDSIGN